MSIGIHIPEYMEDCELVASESLASDPAFWLAHVLLTMGDPGEPAEPYGVDASAISASAAPTKPAPAFPGRSSARSPRAHGKAVKAVRV